MNLWKETNWRSFYWNLGTDRRLMVTFNYDWRRANHKCQLSILMKFWYNKVLAQIFGTHSFINHNSYLWSENLPRISSDKFISCNVLETNEGRELIWILMVILIKQLLQYITAMEKKKIYLNIKNKIYKRFFSRYYYFVSATSLT